MAGPLTCRFWSRRSESNNERGYCLCKAAIRMRVVEDEGVSRNRQARNKSAPTNKMFWEIGAMPDICVQCRRFCRKIVREAAFARLHEPARQQVPARHAQTWFRLTTSFIGHATGTSGALFACPLMTAGLRFGARRSPTLEDGRRMRAPTPPAISSAQRRCDPRRITLDRCELQSSRHRPVIKSFFNHGADCSVH
jgi:hypothetical protein